MDECDPLAVRGHITYLYLRWSIGGEVKYSIDCEQILAILTIEKLSEKQISLLSCWSMGCLTAS